MDEFNMKHLAQYLYKFNKCHLFVLHLHPYVDRMLAPKTNYFVVFIKSQLNNCSQDGTVLEVGRPSGRITVYIRVPHSRKRL